MKPHPRIRKTVKWGGAVVTVLLVVICAGSAGWRFGWDTQANRISVIAGRLVVVIDDPKYDHRSPEGIGLGFRSVPWCWSWSFAINREPRRPTFVYIPLWLMLVPLIGATSIAWRLDTLARRRARLNLCPNCHYDRTGLAPGALCPECGKPTVPS